MKNDLFLVAFMLLLPPMLHAQTAGGEGVLQGARVEVGVNACGVYGANASTLSTLGGGPEGPFNANVATGLGAVYLNDPGSLFTVCGDYWIPGSPEESFGLQFGESPGASTFKNASLGCGTDDIPGSITSYNDAAGVRSIVWQGALTSAMGDVGVEQITRLGINDRYFSTEVRLTNTGLDTINRLYYARSTDPDNDQAVAGAFQTRNTVVAQAGIPGSPSIVEAIGDGGLGCYLAMVSADPRSRVAIGNSGLTFALTNPADVWLEGPGYSQSGTLVQDWSIAIAFRLGPIAPGATDTIRFAHVFDPVAVPASLSGDTGLVCLPPYNLQSLAGIQKAVLRWDGYSNHSGYKLFGGPAGSTPTTLTLTADSLRLKGLMPATAYQWTVRARCSDGSLSNSAPVQDFSTNALRIGQLETGLRLYPNPTQGAFALSGEALSAFETLRVFDLTGRVVHEHALDGRQTLTVDAASWTPGMYTIALQGEGRNKHLRLMVAR